AAVADSRRRLDYAGLDRLMDRIAATLQREGLQAGDAIAICAASSVEYVAIFLGALRAGAVVAPLAPSVTPASCQAMLHDSDARWLFVDAGAAPLLASVEDLRLVALGAVAPGLPESTLALDAWLTGEGG